MRAGASVRSWLRLRLPDGRIIGAGGRVVHPTHAPPPGSWSARQVLSAQFGELGEMSFEHSDTVVGGLACREPLSLLVFPDRLERAVEAGGLNAQLFVVHRRGVVGGTGHGCLLTGAKGRDPAVAAAARPA